MARRTHFPLSAYERRWLDSEQKAYSVICSRSISTEEQAIHGQSIEAQLVSLREYAKENKLKIIDEYIDEGVSARKPYTARPELLRLLSDIENGKIDSIIFIKLDRWFRNIKEYYKVQEILDTHSVTWRTTEEDYETETSAGRFKLNIMLSVAEDEADRTSERVRFILDRKRARGEPTGCLPYGYKTENKRAVIIPEEAENIRKLFNAVIDGVSRTELIHALPGRRLSYAGLRVILSNSAYIGEKNGVPFPPIIDTETFNEVQRIQSTRHSPRKTKERRTYLLSGLLYCPICGARLVGTPGDLRKRDNSRTLYYRCPNHSAGKGCSFGRRISERKAEKYLLEHIESNLQTTIKSEPSGERKTYEAERKRVKQKQKRLTDLYIDGDISKDEYEKRKEALEDEYNAIPEDERNVNIEALKEQFFPDWKSLYMGLSEKAKQTFWLQSIEKIDLFEDGSFKNFEWK